MCVRVLAIHIVMLIAPVLTYSQVRIGDYAYILADQNMITNGDFEDYHEYYLITNPEYFFAENWIFGYQAPAYFHPLHNLQWLEIPSRGVPINRFGYQWAHSGSAYAGFGAEHALSPSGLSETSTVQILSNILLNPLLPGRYMLTFYYSNGFKNFELENEDYVFSPYSSLDYIYVSLNNLGESPVPWPSMSMAYYENFNPSFSVPVQLDTSSWVKAELIIEAYGGEEYFSIGVFNHPRDLVPNYISKNLPSHNWWVTYYYIDDVSMYRIIDSIPVADSVTVTNVTLYPNPSPNGQFTLAYAVHEDAQPVFSVYDATGRLVGTEPLPGGQQRVPLDYSRLANGVYLWRLEQNQGFVGGGKMSVMR